ncbi:hypothetical protein [Streptomyces sp. URMC 123]|uniref:hypothetical protein n=1 Tax=Streptomyces sp. URMC 123 TaxID=3423403 RepID=UPI003F19A087
MDEALLLWARGAPRACPGVGAMGHLDGAAPSIEDVRALVRAALPALPVLTHELRRSGRSVRWEPMADVALARHVRETVVDTAGRASVLEAMYRLWAEPLSPDLGWELGMVRPAAGDGYGLFYRVHHGRQDGVAIGQTLRTLFSPAGPGRVPRATGALGAGSRPARVLRALGTAAAMGIDFCGFRPTGMAGPWDLSGRRRVSTAAVDLPPVRAVARAGRGTVHDVHLAALAGAVRTWHLEAGRDPRPLAVGVALDVRRPDEPRTWGNRLLLRRVWLPCQESDPWLRLLGTIRATEAVKSARTRQTAQDLLGIAPARLVRFTLRRLLDPRYAPVIASYIPSGSDAGAVPPELTDLLPMTLLPPGHPFNVGLTTFGASAQAAVVSDAAVPGADRIPSLWRQEIARLCRAVAPAPLPAPPAGPRALPEGRTGACASP